jgi:hypothetical protein
MVRTTEWKYVHRHPCGPHELFDLRADPGERTNRIDDRSTHAIAAELRGRLDAWFARYVELERDGTDTGVTGCGQLGRVEHATNARPAFADAHMTNTDWDLWVAGEGAKPGWTR